MYIRSLFEKNKNVRDPRQQLASLPIAPMDVSELIFGPIGIIQGDRGTPREMEAPRPISPTNCSGRFVPPPRDKFPHIPSSLLTLRN